MARQIHNPVDVLVAGGGIAALSAALAARKTGASVTLWEASSQFLRGGNTRHSRNLRVMHEEPTFFMPGTYPATDFIAEINKASHNVSDPALTRIFVERSAEIPDWLSKYGVAFQKEYIPFSKKTVFFLGGGRAAVNSLYRQAQQCGIQILYDHPLEHFNLSDPGLNAKSIILCTGSAQGDRSLPYINRGTPFSRGEIMYSLFEQGIASVGQTEIGHLVAVDARFPDDDGGIVTRIDGMEFGVVLDRNGKRFQDETAIKNQTRYSTWGRLIAKQPDHYAVLILDETGLYKAPPSALPPLKAQSLEELASILDMPAGQFCSSAAETGRVKEPPFYAFPLRPGVAFTSLGVKVDQQMRLVREDGAVIKNVFAAGTIMSPNILGAGYLAGVGVSIGAVFGRIAGEEAARHALT